MSKISTLIVILLIIFFPTAHAADSKGAFAVKGAGISTCSRFLEAAKKQDNVYYVYGGWIEGYLTASNQHLDKTFDLAPWQSTQLMLKIVESICQNNPEKQFHHILATVASDMTKQRIDEGGKFVDIDGKRSYVYQEEVIRRMKQALKNKGFFSGPIDGTYDDKLRSSVKDFQKTINQTQSGLPDQGTLYQLFKP